MQQTIEHADWHDRASPAAESDARHWVTMLAPYRESSPGRSLAELFVTVVPFVALWLAMLLSLRYSYWLCLLFAVPAAGFLVRLFMIQHDCGHGAFFRQRAQPQAEQADRAGSQDLGRAAAIDQHARGTCGILQDHIDIIVRIGRAAVADDRVGTERVARTAVAGDELDFVAADFDVRRRHLRGINIEDDR